MKDLSGDGKITQKDVLIGRGVIDKKKMKGGGMAKKGYAKGGKIKMRGAGAATKGFYSRGPMA